MPAEAQPRKRPTRCVLIEFRAQSHLLTRTDGTARQAVPGSGHSAPSGLSHTLHQAGGGQAQTEKGALFLVSSSFQVLESLLMMRRDLQGRPGARDEPNGGESLFPLRMGGGGSAGARAVSPDGAGGDDDDLDDGRHGHHHGRRSRASRTLSPHRDFGKASTRTQRDELEESRFPHRFLVEATDRLQKCKSGLSLVGYVHGDLDLGRLFPPVQVFARSFVHHTTNVCQAVRAPGSVLVGDDC